MTNKHTNKTAEVMNMLSSEFSGGGLSFTPAVYTSREGQTLHYNQPLTGWAYWQDMYYPQVIRESYPVYVKERAEDKGKQAFEIIKALQDKKLMKLEKVSDFIEAMDILIKTL